MRCGNNEEDRNAANGRCYRPQPCLKIQACAKSGGSGQHGQKDQRAQRRMMAHLGHFRTNWSFHAAPKANQLDRLWVTVGEAITQGNTLFPEFLSPLQVNLALYSHCVQACQPITGDHSDTLRCDQA